MKCTAAWQAVWLCCFRTVAGKAPVHMLQHYPVIAAERCLSVMSHNSITFPAVQVWRQVLFSHAVQSDSLFSQVSDAQLAAIRGQGLDPVLPSAPLLHLSLCQCIVEAGVSPAGHQPRDPAPIGQQPAAFQCSNSL